MNVILGRKNVKNGSDVLYTICHVLMLGNNVCNVSYFVLSVMSMIIRCCLIRQVDNKHAYGRNLL